MSVKLVSENKEGYSEKLFLVIKTTAIDMKLDISHGDLLNLETSIMYYHNKDE